MSLNYAHVDVDVLKHASQDSEHVDELSLLLMAISNVKNVSLGVHTLIAICDDMKKEHPILPNVTHLQLEIPDFLEKCDFSYWPTFPNARHLVLNVDAFSSSSLSSFFPLFPNLSALLFERATILTSPDEFDTPEEQGVPTCLQSCLSKIKVCEFEGLQSELELVKYLLEHAQVLEMLTIELCKGEFEEISKEKFQGEIIGMPRSSKIS